MKRENKMGLEGRISYEKAINRNETDCARIVTLQNALYKEEREHNRLIDEYGQLQEDYMKAQEEITKLKNENENLKQSNQHLSEQSGTIKFKCEDIKGKDPFDNAFLKFENGVLKKEIADLKDKLQHKELLQYKFHEAIRIKNDEINDLEEELTALKQDYDQLLDENSKYVEVVSLKNEIGQMAVEYNTLKQHYGELLEEKECALQDYNWQVDRTNDLEDKVSDLSLMNTQYKGRIKQLVKENYDRYKELKEIYVMADEQDEELTNLQKDYSDLLDAYDNLHDVYVKNKSKYDKIVDTLNKFSKGDLL